MSTLMREGLRHAYAGMPAEAFFEEIDKSGGWPVGYQFVGFEHSDARDAGFCNEWINTGWWTVVASADDYYLWKLSPQALQRISDAITARIKSRLASPSVSGLEIRDSRGRIAALSVERPKP